MDDRAKRGLAVGDRDLVDFAHERGGEQAFRAQVNLARRADVGDFASTHHHDAVGDGHGFLLIVRHMHEGGTDAALDGFQLVLHGAAEFQIQRTERFVEQQDIGGDGEGAGKGHPLALAAGEFMRAAKGFAGQTYERQHSLGFGAAFGARDAAHPQAEANVIGERHVGEQGVVLKHRGGRAPGGADTGHIAAADQDAAGDGLAKAADQVQKRGLAAAGRAQEDDELSRCDFQADVVQGEGCAVAVADRLDRDSGGHLALRNRKISIRKTAEIETRKTSDPTALVAGERPERSIDQISTGSVTSKRVRRKAMMNSSQLKVTDRKKAAASAGASIGAAMCQRICASFAPRSRAARSAFFWWSPMAA